MSMNDHQDNDLRLARGMKFVSSTKAREYIQDYALFKQGKQAVLHPKGGGCGLHFLRQGAPEPVRSNQEESLQRAAASMVDKVQFAHVQRTVFRARADIQAEMAGDVCLAYEKLASFMARAVELNEGSVAEVERDAHGVFSRAVLTFGAVGRSRMGTNKFVRSMPGT